MILLCPSPKCGSSLFHEFWVQKFMASQETDPDELPESNKLEVIPGSGHFIYKCAVCGKQAWPVPIAQFKKEQGILD